MIFGVHFNCILIIIIVFLYVCLIHVLFSRLSFFSLAYSYFSLLLILPFFLSSHFLSPSCFFFFSLSYRYSIILDIYLCLLSFLYPPSHFPVVLSPLQIFFSSLPLPLELSPFLRLSVKSLPFLHSPFFPFSLSIFFYALDLPAICHAQFLSFLFNPVFLSYFSSFVSISGPFCFPFVPCWRFLLKRGLDISVVPV